MTRSLFLALFVVGCADATTSPTGKPTLGPAEPASGDAASAGLAEPGLAPANPMVAGDLQLLGVTSDERAVFFDRSSGAVRMISLDGGAAETLGYTTPDAVRIDGSAVFLWTGVSGGVGNLRVRMPDQIRDIAWASLVGLAAASPDGTTLLYVDVATSQGPYTVYFYDAGGRQQLAEVAPDRVRLQFASNEWGLVSSSDQVGGSATVTAYHRDATNVVLGMNVVGAPVVDAPGAAVVLIDSNGYALVTTPGGTNLQAIDAPVAEAAFAGSDIVYRSPDGALQRWSAAAGTTPLYTNVSRLRGVSTDGRWVLYTPVRGGALAVGSISGGAARVLSGHCSRVEAAHDGVVVFDDAGSLRLSDGRYGMLETRTLAPSTTGFRVSPIGDRAAYTTAQGLYVSASF